MTCRFRRPLHCPAIKKVKRYATTALAPDRFSTRQIKLITFSLSAAWTGRLYSRTSNKVTCTLLRGVKRYLVGDNQRLPVPRVVHSVRHSEREHQSREQPPHPLSFTSHQRSEHTTATATAQQQQQQQQSTCVRGTPTHLPDAIRSSRTTSKQIVGQKRPSSTNKNMMIANTSLVLFFLATGFSGLSQAAGAPSRSLRHNDKGDVDVPRLDFRQQFDSEDFVFDLQGAEPEVEGEAGTVKVANLGNVPVLSGEGVSYALVDIEPCGLNLPHHHPRAAEFGYIIKSESSTSVRHAFVEENSGRLIMNDIGEGQVALVPGGLVHFVQNMGCSPATFLAAFSSPDPGVLTTTTQGIAMLSEGTIQAALALGSDEAYAIIAGLPEGVVQGEKECLKRCGLDY